MKKELVIGGVAVVAALSSLVFLGTQSNVDAWYNSIGWKWWYWMGIDGDFEGVRWWKKWHKGMWGDMMWMWFSISKWWFVGNTAIQDALAKNDYNAFITAWNTDNKKPSNATVPTQEQFAVMVVKYAKQQARLKAIENNDYNAFVEATKLTQEEFNQIVTQHKAHIAIQWAIEANDYEAFQKAIAWTPKEWKVTQAQFDKMVQRHQSNTQSN